MKAAIITSSDSGYAGEREDKSGSVIQEILEANDYEVVHTILLPDDRKMLADEMARIADEGIAELIVLRVEPDFRRETVCRRQQRIL